MSGLQSAGLWQAVLDFLVPLRCSLCGQRDVAAGVIGTAYCRDCTDKLCPAPINRCLRCAAEAGPYATTENGCTHCRNHKLRFDSVTCLGMYEETLRRAVLGAKWSWSAVPVRSLARLLIHQFQEDLRALEIDRVIPVPQHWTQRMTRHFNPAWMIAEELAAALHVPCDVHLLRRVRRTKAQKRVSLMQRFGNQKDTLQLKDGHVVKNERVLIVDDVLTTGATCSEASRILKHAGARKCHVAVIARVLDHSA